nr:PucR family transcriptional regulator ligand-binding domain-containing protein [Mediterraneibacter faecis]
MNYTIKEFIESNKFPKMQLISDNSGINRVIRGVQILSVPNMEKFLGGGELLLTSLVVYENQLNERIVLTHLEELNKKQVSGLIIAEDNEKFVPNILTQYEYIRQKRETIEYIKKINILDQSVFYLVISEVNEPLIELDFITLENVIIKLLYILTQVVTEKILKENIIEIWNIEC